MRMRKAAADPVAEHELRPIKFTKFDPDESSAGPSGVQELQQNEEEHGIVLWGLLN
jgi:hypothetical protein